MRYALMVFILVMSFSPKLQAQSYDHGVLILEVRDNGKHSPRLAAYLEKQLPFLGIEIRSGESLSPQNRACRDTTGCLPDLARKHRAARLLWLSIDPEPQNRRYIEVRGYDAAKDRLLDGEPFSCSEERTEQALTELTQKLLTPAAAAPPPPPPSAAWIKAQPLPLQRRGLPAWRKGLGAGFALLGAAALGGAIALTVMHEREVGTGCPLPNIPNERCEYSNTAAFGISYAAAGLLAAGSGLTLGLPF